MSSDVFISYTKDDLTWAERFENELTRRGLNVFRDRTRIQAGDPWRSEVIGHLDQTKCILVLWSKRAQVSQWVNYEITFFERTIRVPDVKAEKIQKRMIFVLLDDENETHNHLQQITDFRDANVYDRGSDQVDAQNPNLWPTVVRKVYDGVTASQNFVNISLLI